MTSRLATSPTLLVRLLVRGVDHVGNELAPGTDDSARRGRHVERPRDRSDRCRATVQLCCRRALRAGVAGRAGFTRHHRRPACLGTRNPILRHFRTSQRRRKPLSCQTGFGRPRRDLFSHLGSSGRVRGSSWWPAVHLVIGNPPELGCKNGFKEAVPSKAPVGPWRLADAARWWHPDGPGALRLSVGPP